VRINNPLIELRSNQVRVRLFTDQFDSNRMTIHSDASFLDDLPSMMMEIENMDFLSFPLVSMVDDWPQVLV
jgi:hypothetical protein